MSNRNLTVKDVAEFLGVCIQRIHAKIKQGHFPGAHNCECGKSFLIPQEDVFKQSLQKRISTNAKKSTRSNSNKSNSGGGARR